MLCFYLQRDKVGMELGFSWPVLQISGKLKSEDTAATSTSLQTTKLTTSTQSQPLLECQLNVKNILIFLSFYYYKLQFKCRFPKTQNMLKAV